MKISHITPIIKRPNLDKSSLCNYRPISNPPNLSKILERTVVSQLKTYLYDNNILNKDKSAYIKNKSTETALIETLIKIAQTLDITSPYNTLLTKIHHQHLFHTIKTT